MRVGILVVFLLGGCAGVDRVGDGDPSRQDGVKSQVADGFDSAAKGFWKPGMRALTPADFKRSELEESGNWTIAGWEVKAEKAWVQRERPGGEIVRLYAEGKVRAKNEELEIFGLWISVQAGGLPVIAECEQVKMDRRTYLKKFGSFRFEYAGENRMRFLGPVTQRGFWNR